MYVCTYIYMCVCVREKYHIFIDIGVGKCSWADVAAGNWMEANYFNFLLLPRTSHEYLKLFFFCYILIWFFDES